ncbi:hypothetical protein CRENBAI_001182 [Crenichthys baileyi]|uniref:Uncharacterized protein n=1 Tax=Crenichthys baileyi TaxID=28760 RepID=A0AAV9R885_9TELE
MNTDGSVEELNRRPPGESCQRKVSLLLSGGFCQYMYPDTNSVLRAAEGEIRRSLHFTPCELNKTESSCSIPGFLSDLVESKLKVWIENAFLAQTMKTDQEYVLEDHGIVLVDYSCTDVLENCMKWCDGLQQFLEMKHQSKLSDMAVITNYMSNIGLLQKYKCQIYGLSGTLGQEAEIKTLRRIYEGIKTCQIPSFKRRKLFEIQGVIMKDEKEWMRKICHVVTEQTQATVYREQRAVLVICETIKRAKLIDRAFGRKVPNKKLYVNNNMDNTAISEMLQAGDVIIATNLAGRGTDLKISNSVKAAGGLFVVKTLLPKNARVEAQAFGRAGRQGSPGSGQLIVCFSQIPLNLFEKCNLDMMTAKKIRDDLAAKELRAYMDLHIPKIKKEEELFSVYLEKLKLLYKSANNNPAATDVSALNEFWGIWLLTKVSERDCIVTLTKLLKADLGKALEKLRKRQTPLSNLHHYTVHGRDLQKLGKLSETLFISCSYIQMMRRSFICGAVLGQQGGAQFVAVAGRSMLLLARRHNAGGSLAPLVPDRAEKPATAVATVFVETNADYRQRWEINGTICMYE